MSYRRLKFFGPVSYLWAMNNNDAKAIATVLTMTNFINFLCSCLIKLVGKSEEHVAMTLIKVVLLYQCQVVLFW